MSNSLATPWTVAHQALLSVGFPRQEYQSGLPFPSPGDFPDPGIKPMSLISPALQVGSLPGKAVQLGKMCNTLQSINEGSSLFSIVKEHIESEFGTRMGTGISREGEALERFEVNSIQGQMISKGE